MTGIYYTVNHSGKMSGIHSLSTSVLDNKLCMKSREIADSICKKCYAVTLTDESNARHLNNEYLKGNSKVLVNGIIPQEFIPMTTTFLFRFESFGDLMSWQQAANYFLIAKAYPQSNFALWTKRPGFIAQAIKKGYNKPKNIQIVISSLYMNKPCRPRWSFADKIFTVYDKDFAKANDICINCKKHCIECQLCYTRQKNKGITYVNELLKR